MTGGTLYLWLVLCLDGAACTNAQVYQIDQFTGPAAVTDCKDIAKARRTEMKASVAANWRIGCKTRAEFDRDGI